MRKLEEILRDTIAITEEQIESARALNADGLNETTTFRQELLFELEVAMKHTSTLSAEQEELAYELRELDARLERLLSAGLATFDALRNDGAVPVYNHEGRIKGSTP